jgi:hypothetical protein
MTHGRADPPPTSEGVALDVPIDTLVGLRADDLGLHERRTLTLTLGDPEAVAEVRRARALTDAIQALPSPASTLHAGVILDRLADRHRRRARARAGVASALATATGLLLATAWVASWPSPPPIGAATLEAHVTTGGVRRAVSHGSELPDDGLLTLAIATSTPGSLFVTERFAYDTVRTVAPTSGRWEVPAGLHPLGAPLTRPDRARTTLYEAWLCPSGAQSWSREACSRGRLLVHWP